MSKFTKYLVLFLLVALLIAQMLPVHAASAETLPEINPNLCGLVVGDLHYGALTYNLSSHNRIHYLCSDETETVYDNVIQNVVVLGHRGQTKNYYLDQDDQIFCEWSGGWQSNLLASMHTYLSHQNVQMYYDYAPAPLAAQESIEGAIAIPNNMCGLSLVSLGNGGDAIDSEYVDFNEQLDLSDITAKYIEEYNGEYYLLDCSGTIWCISIAVSEQLDRIMTGEVYKVAETGVNATDDGGFYFDGDMIYRTYNTANGSCLMAIDPDTKAVYNYGVVEEGVTIVGLYVDHDGYAPNSLDDLTPTPETLPEINPNLCGVINGQDNLQLYNLSKKAKSYLEYRGDSDMAFDNVVCMLNQNNVLTTYYVGEDNQVYLEDEQDHRFVEPAYSVEKQYFDYAPAPLMGQVDNGCVITVPKEMCGLTLVSFCSEMEFDSTYLPFDTHVTDLLGIAAKYIENNKGEYYLLGIFGDIWSVTVEITEHPDEIIIGEPEKIVDTGVPGTGEEGFYYDGELIYRTYWSYPENSSCLMAIDPETKTIYNYGVIEEGVTIWGLYEVGKMAPNCNDIPTPYDFLDATLNGLFYKDGQGDNRIVTFNTKKMRNEKQPLEFEGDPELVLTNVVCQENAAGEIETYYFGDDRYVYIEDEQDPHTLIRTVRLGDWHCDYAPSPLNYQKTNGCVVGVYKNGLALTLTSLITGEEENGIDLINWVEWDEHYRPISMAAIAAKTLTGDEAEYYLLDMNGIIWSATISFPDFKMIDMRMVADTCEDARGSDGFYFDGTWLFRTYWDNNKNASVVMAYHPETDIFYDLGILEEGMTVCGLYEAGKIPTVEPHEHDWAFVKFRWDMTNGYKAYVVYQCPICSEVREREATVKLLARGLYLAKISMEDSLDGQERTEMYRVMIKNEIKPNKPWNINPNFDPFKPLDPIPTPVPLPKDRFSLRK